MKNNDRSSLRSFPPPQNERQRRRTKLAERRPAVEQTVRDLGGVLAPTKDFADDRDHVERMIASETAPTVTHRDWLKRHGLAFVSPDDLPADKLPGELNRLIHALAFARVFLQWTDHLDDVALYHKLWHEILGADEPDVPRLESEAEHWDLSEPGMDDNQTWLRYYASNDDRESWADEYPEDPMPDHQPCIANRDRDLPQPHRYT